MTRDERTVLICRNRIGNRQAGIIGAGVVIHCTACQSNVGERWLTFQRFLLVEGEVPARLAQRHELIQEERRGELQLADTRASINRPRERERLTR